MGIVYLAEQAEPFRRQVALKVIKIGMDTREVVARFEAERQALALMSHSHIAQIFGAGATDDGRPYFVMEHVAGVPITDYCDRNELSTRERLDLFVLLCSAVEHAHQKGIIHRDIKPQNILVTVQDGRPVPKVIDFGVAKATHQRLTEKTVFTHLGLIIGTPEYMSPEQAELGGVEITKATDIYSLGVLLYELLVSALPFDPTRLRRAGYAEIQRIIREEEPVAPSTRLGGLGTKASDVARQRRTDVSNLARDLKGNLDCITLKALEKAPASRYLSAAELGADVSRHLTSDPIHARRATLTRVRRFARRHPVRIAFAGVVPLVVAIAGAAWLWVSGAGVSLSFDKPVSGTVIGGGLVCGTHGSVCSTKRPAGDSIELLPVADPGYVLAGFTGDCAPAGRVSMATARICGARFRKAEPVAAAVTWPLTIEQPAGGTIVSAGGLLCGTLGSLCNVSLPDGAPVALRAIADANHQFVQFTGACAERGETVMTSARVCGATFVRADRRGGSTLSSAESRSPHSAPPASSGQLVSAPTTVPSTSSDEEHARRDIEQFIYEYCSAMQSLEPARIKRLFPSSDEKAYELLFRQYASLTCSITTRPTFLRLDARATDASAEVAYGMKQQLVMKSGGPPREQETDITVVLSRRDRDAPWLIERMSARPKAKE